jgi:vesicle-associated membrane protein-associated protein A
MSKLDQILVIDPANELKFIGPFSNVVTSELKLTNPSGKKVAFKVKTTAPKRYCVRPNSGLIEPNAQVTVSVMLQPFEYDPAEKNNHKFMVQSLFAPTATVESLDQLWKEAAPSQLMDSKLRCVFELPARDDTVQNNLDKTTPSFEDNVKVTPTKHVPVTAAAVPGTGSEKTPAKQQQQSSPSGAGDEEVRRVQTECQHLSEEIQRLREDNNRLRDEGVRLRKVAGTPAAGLATAAPSSTPMHSDGFQLSAVEPSLLAQPTIFYLIAMLILGVIVGKFLL